MKIINIVLCSNNSTLITDTGKIINIPSTSINNNFLINIVVPEIHKNNYFECADDAFATDESIQDLLEHYGIELPKNIKVEKVKHVFTEAIRSENIEGLKLFTEKLKKVNKEREFSVESCIDFMEHSDLPITAEGNILGYKYLNYYRNSKNIFVDCHTEKIQQKVGSVVKMDIKAVDPNRAIDCSYGLHVASYDYLKDFGGDILALVLVRPEDIISVPESDTAKIRVCKYQILTVLDNNEGKLSNDEISFWINLPAPLPKEIVEIKGRTQDFTVTPIQQKNSEPKKKPKKEIKSGKISKEKKSSIVNNVKEIVDNLKKKDIEKLMIKLLDTGELTQDEIQQILNYKKKAKKSLNALFGTSRANYFRKYIGEIK